MLSGLWRLLVRAHNSPRALSPLPPKKGTKPHPAEKFEDTQIFVFLASSSHVAALYLGALFHLAVNHVLGKVSTGR